MISMLHISDLHLTENPDWGNMKSAVLSYAEEAFRDIPDGGKLLIVTGDFHNYADGSYEAAKDFLGKLTKAMGVDPARDVFAVPGNHDVSADSNYERVTLVKTLKNGQSDRNELNALSDFRKYAMPILLSSYGPYQQFVRDAGVYPAAQDSLPVEVHVRTWRDRLHILHLNTALIADGSEKTGQLVDALTATSDSVKAALRDGLPCIAIGHNSYMDLDEQLQEEALKGAFFHGNISAYLCGDQHEAAYKIQDRMIYLDNQGSIQIQNIVAPRGSADQEDRYSEFGMLLHQWDETTGEVVCVVKRWAPDNPGHITDGEKWEYHFRSDQKPPDGETPERPPVASPETERPTDAPSVEAQAPTDAPSVEAQAPADAPSPVETGRPSDVMKAEAWQTKITDENGKILILSPQQEKFLADLQELYEKHGFHMPIGRVHYMGVRLIDDMNNPNVKLARKSRALTDFEKLLKATIEDMENDLEDLNPDKWEERIPKLEQLLSDLKAL